MSSFIENFSSFLSKCMGDMLHEVHRNRDISIAKAKGLEIVERLQASIPVEQKGQTIDYLDDLGALYLMENSYSYLCGLRDADQSEPHCKAADIPAELLACERYADLKAKLARSRKELDEALNDGCRTLLDEYIQNQNIITGVTKSNCYSGGLRDKKRLDSQIDLSATKEWNELINVFL